MTSKLSTLLESSVEGLDVTLFDYLPGVGQVIHRLNRHLIGYLLEDHVFEIWAKAEARKRKALAAARNSRRPKSIRLGASGAS